MTDIIVPSMGESVTEATVASWVKQEGDAVQADEPLVELETDKVTVEVNAPASGTLQAIKAQEGDTVEVGAVLGAVQAGEGGGSEKASQQESDKKTEKSSEADSGKEGSDKKEDSSEDSSKDKKSSSQGRESSDGHGPAANKLMAERGLSANQIQGSGRDGRITKGDVLKHQPGSAEASEADRGPREQRVKMTKLRQTIAKRLKESQDKAAILTTFNEVDMTAVVELRKRYKDNFAKRYGVKLGFMSFFIKACVNALQEFPAVNAEIDGQEIVYKNYYDIGVAVGTEQGLVVPVVRDADRLSFADVEGTIGELGKKARDGKLSMKEMTGGTFSITNGGVYGSLLSTPIINPPQSAILGMHKIQQRPMAIDGEVVIRPMMYLALSYDHRIIDGKESVSFLVRVKEALEEPERLLIGM